MSATTIEVRVQVGEKAYSLQMVGDPEDVMMAVSVGRAVTSCLIEHATEERAQR